MNMNINDLAEEDGLLFGCLLDGKGGASIIGWKDVEKWKPGDKTLWVHLDRNSPRVEKWLRQDSDLTYPTIDALLEPETRPRVFRGRKGVVSILRGVNMNPDANPEDMVAIRMWSDGKRLITLRHHRLMTPRDILQQLIEYDDGPHNASQLYERLICRLTERMAITVSSYNEALDTMEVDLNVENASEIRRQLSDVRRNAVILRRYMAPQREALDSLVTEPPDWLEDRSRLALRETSNHLLRYIEELDAARERSIVIKDDISNQLAESTNSRLYVLSIISAVFLPLGFLTGLLGINVGGMPGVDNDMAFWVACGLMLAVLVVAVLIMRRLKWF